MLTCWCELSWWWVEQTSGDNTSVMQMACVWMVLVCSSKLPTCSCRMAWVVSRPRVWVFSPSVTPDGYNLVDKCNIRHMLRL